MPLKQAIPDREDLIERIRRANQFAYILVPIQVALIAVLVLLIRWDAALNEPLTSLIAVSVMVGPLLMAVMREWAQNKKRIDDLKETTRFGVFDKHNLKRLYQETLTKLGLPDDQLPVYITGDRSMNAAARHWGLGSIFKSLNGIYLHRQVLHKLTPEEVQDIIGHELGHYYRHFIVLERFRSISLILGALLGLLVAQKIGLGSTIGLFALMLIGSAFWLISGILSARNATIIEYLCDDFGAQVHGVAVSINGLLKLGAEAELHCAVIHHALLNKNSDKLDARELLDAVQNAIPYGDASPDEILDAVELAIRRRIEQRKISIVGFLSYLWNMEQSVDENDALEEEIKKLEKLQSIPRLAWESLLPNPRNIAFDESTLPKLVDLIEREPQSELFRTPDSVDRSDQVHPPIKKRILYLWYNRDQIARSERSYTATG
jgi:Zn-dependent protease with chaperone function